MVYFLLFRNNIDSLVNKRRRLFRYISHRDSKVLLFYFHSSNVAKIVREYILL